MAPLSGRTHSLLCEFLTTVANSLASPAVLLRRWVSEADFGVAWVMGKFSETLMEHFTSPRNRGVMEFPDLVGQAGLPGAGPYLVLYLRVAQERVIEAKFHCHGCGVTIAAGSMLTQLVRGRRLQECLSLTAQALTEALGGVPADKLHSPALAVAALQQALRQHQPAAGR